MNALQTLIDKHNSSRYWDGRDMTAIENLILAARIIFPRLPAEAAEELADLRADLDAAHRLLDLRDERYFEFCETGILPEKG